MLTMCSNAAAFPLVYHSFSAGIASGYFTLFPARQAVMEVVSIPFRSRSVAPEPLMSAVFLVTTINPFVIAVAAMSPATMGSDRLVTAPL